MFFYQQHKPTVDYIETPRNEIIIESFHKHFFDIWPDAKNRGFVCITDEWIKQIGMQYFSKFCEMNCKFKPINGYHYVAAVSEMFLESDPRKSLPFYHVKFDVNMNTVDVSHRNDYCDFSRKLMTVLEDHYNANTTTQA